MNPTTTVAIITAISVIVSSSLTALIQNRSTLNQKKMDYKLKSIELSNKKRELLYDKKSELYKKFASSYNALRDNSFIDPCNLFLSTSYQTMLFSDEASKQYIKNLIQLLKTSNMNTTDETDDIFEDCIECLIEDLGKSKNKDIK